MGGRLVLWDDWMILCGEGGWASVRAVLIRCGGGLWPGVAVSSGLCTTSYGRALA